LAERQQRERQRTAAEAAATRVEFFTMARERD
jgi:alpha-D-ribose 1-methylphosphonate 5-triphosphate synthase subunit PhnG